MIDPMIRESQARCRHYGLRPEDLPVPRSILNAAELKHLKHKYHEVLTVVQHLGEKVLHLLAGTPVMILVSDHQGNIISLFGDPSIKAILHQLHITEGLQLSERELGTNVIHLALTLKKPVQLIGQDHFHKVLHQSACYCVPFGCNESVPLSGSIALMTSATLHNPFTLPFLVNLVDSMERELLLRQKSQHQTIISDLMITTTQNGVILTDAKGNVVDFNRFAEKITNRTREMVIGNPVFAFEQFGNYVYEVLKNKKTFEDIELTFTNSLEHRFVVLFGAMPIFDEQGDLLGAYAQFRDISERDEADKQLILSEKYSVIGKLGAGLAHEIRNPLTSVMGFIHLMRERSMKDDEHNYLNLIYAELESMKHLISEFVLMAKPDSPEKKQCCIEDLIRDTIISMDQQALLNNGSIIESFHSLHTVIQIDPGQIRQVLINLIQNALEAMPEGGSVTVGTKLAADNRFFHIQISDEGSGMTEEQMNEVMNPFYTTKESALGLGLSTCYSIVDNHEGKLSFTSKLGVGTTFTVSLPMQ